VRVKYMPWARFCRYFDLWIIAFVSIPLRIPDLSAGSAQRAGRDLMTSVREGSAANQDSPICELLAGDNEFSQLRSATPCAALSVSIRSDLGRPKSRNRLHETTCQSCGTPVKFEINHEMEPLMKRNLA
jgi:hypothetical protein